MQYYEKAKENKDWISVMKEVVWQPLFSHQTRNQVPELQNENTPTHTASLAEERMHNACSLGYISVPNGILFWKSQPRHQSLYPMAFCWSNQKERTGVYSVESMIIGIIFSVWGFEKPSSVEGHTCIL